MVRMFGTTEDGRAGCSKSSSGKAAVSEEPRRTLWGTLSLNGVGTMLADFFSILLGS
jgi:hypothetical protein